MLGKISVLGFEPKTANPGNEVERKIALRDEIGKTEQDLEDLKLKCRGTQSLIVVFYLWGKAKNSTRYTKDLDNLLKILLDVLPDYMGENKKEPGLGLFENDKIIHEIYVRKEIVLEKTKEGISIKMYGSSILEKFLFRVALLLKS